MKVHFQHLKIQCWHHGCLTSRHHFPFSSDARTCDWRMQILSLSYHTLLTEITADEKLTESHLNDSDQILSCSSPLEQCSLVSHKMCLCIHLESSPLCTFQSQPTWYVHLCLIVHYRVLNPCRNNQIDLKSELNSREKKKNSKSSVQLATPEPHHPYKHTPSFPTRMYMALHVPHWSKYVSTCAPLSLMITQDFYQLMSFPLYYAHALHDVYYYRVDIQHI